MTHKAMKFRVKNPEHSKAIQERLFEMGYKWSGDSDSIIQKLDSDFLFAYKSDMTITKMDSDESYFNKHEATETTLEEITEWTPKQGEMIEVSMNKKWYSVKFIGIDDNYYVCLYLDEYFGFKQARPINPIRREIEELKAKLNELEAKL